MDEVCSCPIYHSACSSTVSQGRVPAGSGVPAPCPTEVPPWPPGARRRPSLGPGAGLAGAAVRSDPSLPSAALQARRWPVPWRNMPHSATLMAAAGVADMQMPPYGSAAELQPQCGPGNSCPSHGASWQITGDQDRTPTGDPRTEVQQEQGKETPEQRFNKNRRPQQRFNKNRRPRTEVQQEQETIAEVQQEQEKETPEQRFNKNRRPQQRFNKNRRREQIFNRTPESKFNSMPELKELAGYQGSSSTGDRTINGRKQVDSTGEKPRKQTAPKCKRASE